MFLSSVFSIQAGPKPILYMFGFHSVVSAMVLASVDSLTDEEPQPKSTEEASSSAPASAKSKPVGKKPAEPKPKTTKTSKTIDKKPAAKSAGSKTKSPGKKSPGKTPTKEKETEEEGKEVEVVPKKRPGVLRKPAAAVKEFKCYKYMYKNGKWAYKTVDDEGAKREVFSVTCLGCQTNSQNRRMTSLFYIIPSL